MLIKLLLSTPSAALLSYTFTSYQNIEFSAVERLGIEFILLGRVPGTEVYIQFEHLLVAFMAIVWIPAVFIAGKSVKKMVDLKIKRVGEQLELISL